MIFQLQNRAVSAVLWLKNRQKILIFKGGIPTFFFFFKTRLSMYFRGIPQEKSFVHNVYYVVDLSLPSYDTWIELSLTRQMKCNESYISMTILVNIRCSMIGQKQIITTTFQIFTTRTVHLNYRNYTEKNNENILRKICIFLQNFEKNYVFFSK